MKETEERIIVPRLAGVSQAELNMVVRDIAALSQYSTGVQVADATARVLDIVFIMKSSGKAENYNAAWFGDQAKNALDKGRLDIAMMAVTLGLGNAMSRLTKEDQSQLAGIITMKSTPGEAALRKLTIKIEIALAQSDAEDNRKVLGAETAARIGKAANEAAVRLKRGDVDGAERLISMDRAYSTLAVAGEKWAGRSEMEDALGAEIAGKDGSARFQQGIDALARQARIVGLISQQMKQLELEQRLGGDVGPVAKCLKLASDSFDTALKAAQDGDLEGARYVYSDAIRQKAVALAMHSEAATYGTEEVISASGAMSGLAENLEKAAQARKGTDASLSKVFKEFEQKYGTGNEYQRLYGDGEDRFGVARFRNYEQMNARLFDILAGRMPTTKAAADEMFKTLKGINDGIALISITALGIAKMKGGEFEATTSSIRDDQDRIYRLVTLKAGQVDSRGLAEATKIRKDMELDMKVSAVTSNVFTYAGGVMLFAMGLPFAGTAMFGMSSYENIHEEHRITGDVSTASWVWGAIAVLPLVGWLGRGSKLVRFGVGGVMTGATIYSMGNTFNEYLAAMNEKDPEKRSDHLSNAILGTIYLLPAAMMVPGGLRAGRGALQATFEEMAPMPSKAQLQEALVPFYTVGHGINKKPITRTPGGTLVEAETPLKIEGTPDQIRDMMRPKSPGFIKNTFTSIKEHVIKSKEKIEKAEAPSVEDFGKSTGKVIAEMMDKAPQNIVEIMRAVYIAAKDAKGRDDSNYWAVLRRCFANEEVRKQVVAVAQTDPLIAEMAQFMGTTISQAAKGSRTSVQLFMRSVDNQTRTQGMPQNEALAVIEALEMEGTRRNQPKLAMTHQILGVDITASDRSALILNLEGKAAKVGKSQVPVVTADIILNENFELTQHITAELNRINPGKDPLLLAFKQDLMAEAANAKDFDSAVLAALKGKNFTAEMKAAGDEPAAKLATAVDGAITTGGEEAGGANAAVKAGRMTDVKAAMPPQIRTVIEAMDSQSKIRDYMLAAAKLSGRVSDITNGVQMQAGGLATDAQGSTAFGVLWDWTKGIAVTKAWPALKFFEWGYGGAIMRAMPGTRLRTAFKGRNIIPFVFQAATWYVEGKAIWNYGLHPLYNMLTQAGTVDEGRKAAYDRFGVSISRENAIFARSDEGREFMLYIPNMFPKGTDRRPTNDMEMRGLLDKNDIIFEMNKIDDALGDGRQMAAALPRINSLLRSNDAQLQTLLASMGISLADAKALLAKSGKTELGIRDMADLRMDDWVGRGVAYRFRNVVANTLCYDLGMDEATAKKDAKFLAGNTDAFMVLWNEFQNGNLPGVWLDKAIDALSAAGVMDALRAESDFRGAAIAKLQAEKVYLKVPIQKDSFLAVLDERPYGMPGARAADPTFKDAFESVLEKYRDDPQALARFNAFTINGTEDIYGDAGSLAAIISKSGSPQDVLATARKIGLVAPATLALKDPSLLKKENAELVKFVVEHSSRDAKTFEVTEENGVYRWFLDNRPHMLKTAAILADLAQNSMAAKTSPNRLYTPKSAMSYLSGQEEYFQSKGWWTGWAPPKAAAPAKGIKAPPTSAETEAAERKKEMERRYPRTTGYVQRVEVVQAGPQMSAEALEFYASPVATTLSKLVDGMKLDDTSRDKVYGMLNSANPRDRAAVRLATINVERDAEGKITAVNVQDSTKAKQWLRSYLK